MSDGLDTTLIHVDAADGHTPDNWRLKRDNSDAGYSDAAETSERTLLSRLGKG